jgi:hypothetical protein
VPPRHDHTVAVEERQVRAFVVGRGFLDRAELLGEDDSEPGRMGAVVLADLAVEMAAKAAVLDQSLVGRPRVDKDWSLPDVLKALVGLWRQREDTEVDVPEVLEARRLHDLRNTVQHDGVAPSRDQVVVSRVRAREFLSWVAAEWFGVPLEAISRARLIENEAVRTPVELAERAAADEDYSTAAQHLAVAFEMARRELPAGMYRGQYVQPVSDSDVGEAISEVRKGSGDTGGLGWPRFNRLLRGFVYQLDTLHDQVEALSLGARASDYAWFKRNFPEVHGVMLAGRALPELVAYPPVEPIPRAVYLHGLDFVTTTALHWQEFPTADPKEDAEGD